ncbi:hypothetical protein Cgig2_006756 [Carnegiea gigantea]|uniref:Agglutinin domain-containing protein n=1 Tax=Carnegiea gigantea TaxID=171969 RepID=A0A9Q1GLJ0_9CARY|nr:hypothetical protein Cgig2_006756 [Carnegiea gigantea]
MAVFALPSLLCLGSVYNDKYLRYRYENVQTRGLLQFTGENVMGPYAQFEVEKAKTWAGLVHLKSRYTNKYLVRFPRRVVFKGDNGLFLGATMHDGQPGLRFAFSDPKDPQVVQQIFPAPDGTIFIRRPRGTENTDVMFRHSVLDTNSVALFSMKTTTFLKRYTSTTRESFLRALALNIDRFAPLLVVDMMKAQQPSLLWDI